MLGSESGGRSVPAGNGEAERVVEGKAAGAGGTGFSSRIVGGDGDWVGGRLYFEDEPSNGSGSGHSNCGLLFAVEGAGLAAGGKLRGMIGGGGVDGSTRKLPRLSGITGGGEVGKPGGGMVAAPLGAIGAPRNAPGAGVTVVVSRPNSGFRHPCRQPLVTVIDANANPIIQYDRIMTATSLKGR